MQKESTVFINNNRTNKKINGLDHRERSKRKKLIKEWLLKSSLKKGDWWYLIPYKWWSAWKNSVHYDEEEELSSSSEDVQIEPLDNSFLMENGKLKQGLMDSVDYYVVPQVVWNQLKDWYDDPLSKR